MKGNVFWIVAAAGLALVGCNKAESPAEVQHDVTEARADAQRDVSDAQADARENMADAQKDVQGRFGEVRGSERRRAEGL